MASGDGIDAREVEREDPVYEAAAGWVARLSSPDATEADRGAFEAWHAADPAHAEAYAEMEALWQTLGHVPDRRHRRSLPKGLAGVAVAMVLCAALAVQLGLVDRLRCDLWSGVGDITHATLADGSRIDLNTDTAIALHFSETERGIELLRGEAFFDVVPDPRRPFVVHGDELSVRAVGTRFFVRAGGTDKPAGVVEGSVDVTASGRPVRVSAGEALIHANGAPLSVVRADVDRATAWRAGRLVFTGERLSTVLAELDRYRRGAIVLLDAAAGERRVTGSFDATDTDEALDAIASSMGVSITRLSPLLILVGSPRRNS
ncbi:iron dicitrate transport regulator FecR [Methylobacterium sp. Leaf104]|uniref:FecR family protein n=1 Tax=Methylobacterium TaxID=407 RepID=UPI0006FE7533|nr:FecR family protein [Methylobacterium sp. Leaf104]KQP30643.1 iron dicitrate transport regulator FecR [Methylobacterium sp. Leaf104]MCI9881967.1 FecR family protein [Methylobacterium goesingense]